MAKPKATQNKVKDIETPDRAKLERELGQLVYKIERLKRVATPLQQRANQIGAILEGIDNGKNV